MKFRSADVNLYLNQLRKRGYVTVSVISTDKPRSTTYTLHNKSLGKKAVLYRTVNSWMEITFSKLQ